MITHRTSHKAPIGPTARPRHAHLLRVQVGIAADDAARAEVHPLAHQRAAESALLRLQPFASRETLRGTMTNHET